MGLLDDAIREHLDLKRRRGADPSEVARLEQEALGPVRREPAPDAEPADEHHDAPHAPEPAAAEPSAPAPDPAPAREPAPAPAPRPSGEDPRHHDIVDQATTEYRVEDHHDEDEHEASAAHAGPDEDVLEETPEFLQETPEHDRLWFEQRPPRDFDFDG